MKLNLLDILFYFNNYRCLEIIRCKILFEWNNIYDFIELFFGIMILMNLYFGFYIKMVIKKIFNELFG